MVPLNKAQLVEAMLVSAMTEAIILRFLHIAVFGFQGMEPRNFVTLFWRFARLPFRGGWCRYAWGFEDAVRNMPQPPPLDLPFDSKVM